MTIRTILSAAGLSLAAAVFGVHPDAAAAPAGTSCDRACLNAVVDRYMEALLAHDPARIRWAKHVEFTENSVPMRIGDGLWNTITKQNAYKLYFADPQAGQAGFY